MFAGSEENLPALDPIYSEIDADECIRQFVNIGYERSIPIADGVTLTFIDAGHILGSSAVHLNIANGKHNIVFSGDQKYEKSWLFELIPWACPIGRDVVSRPTSIRESQWTSPS